MTTVPLAPMPISTEAAPVRPAPSTLTDKFKAVFRTHPAGVGVITADDGSGPVAMTVSSLASVSAEPPFVVFSLSDFSRSSAIVRKAPTLVVHLPRAEQVELAKLGATPGVDRFADRSQWGRLETGEPYFPVSGRRLRCSIVTEVRAGNATVILARVLDITDDPEEDGGPLVYHNRTWHSLGAHSAVS
ncbi:flavin reductase family protein [Microbacterium laevaniformans]|uniref:flavin reductase family protein n=1 Tax=Microbacterium laevaniformans TaxID=36807 RepID=UPI00363D102C